MYFWSTYLSITFAVSPTPLCVLLQVYHLPQDRGGEEHVEPSVAGLQDPCSGPLQRRLWQVLPISLFQTIDICGSKNKNTTTPGNHLSPRGKSYWGCHSRWYTVGNSGDMMDGLLSLHNITLPAVAWMYWKSTQKSIVLYIRLIKHRNIFTMTFAVLEDIQRILILIYYIGSASAIFRRRPRLRRKLMSWQKCSSRVLMSVLCADSSLGVKRGTTTQIIGLSFV